MNDNRNFQNGRSNSGREAKKQSFQLNLDSELKKIPDYGGTHAAVKKRKPNIFLKIMLAVIIVGVSVFLSLVIIFAAQEVFGLGKEQKSIDVEIAQNSGVAQIAEELESRGVIRSAYLFRAYYKFGKLQGNFQYGTYTLDSSMSYSMIVEELSKYSQMREEITVTFPEGFTIYQIAQRLEEKGVCKAVDFVKAIREGEFDYDFLKDLPDNPLRYHRLEGYIFPDTYKFFTNDSAINVIDKMLQNFDNRVTAEMREKASEMGMSMDELVTVASIVQAEAGKTTEMRKVSSVYHNRMENPGTYPNLQADPTRGYARELEEQMEEVNPEILAAYDTYESAGLPPGAICNPGLEAIKATLNPEETDYYFFCSNLETREFFYAKTLAEHNQNLRKAGLA